MDSHTQVELEIDAKYEVERFKKYNPTFSAEETLLDMAKSYVYLQKRYNKQENFFLAVFGSVTIGSLAGVLFAFLSGEWNNLFWFALVLIGSVSVAIFLYGEKRKK